MKGSEDEDDEVKAGGRNLNKLFSGGGEKSSSDGEASEDDDLDFQSKMNKKQRKSFKKEKTKDRILLSKPSQS